MENPSKKIYSLLQSIASEMGAEGVAFSLERPKDESHGDLASNIALVLSKKLHQKPFELAKEIVGKISQEKDLISEIQAVPPGFINFWFSKTYLQNQVHSIIEQGNSYGSSDLGKGKKVSVEFVSANPTGPLHIGNARGGPLGDSIANVLSKVGYSVTREYLHNDVGGQIDRLGEAIYFELNPEAKTEDYVIQYQGSYIKELAELVKEEIYEDEDLSQAEFIEKSGKVAVRIMLEEILKDCKAMGIKYDVIRKESDLRREVPEVLEKIKKNLKVNEGALWFAPNDEFLKDRETVVKKSNGEYTYFASDIAYHNQKLGENDLVIDVFGANHSGHVPRLQAVVKALGFDPNNLKFVLYQWIRLKRGDEIVKMSKRAGSFVTAREVLDEVGKDAFRFFLLTPRSQTHMDFDLELAKKRASDNPVFYVQYAYSRICSIFTRAKNQYNSHDLSLLQTPEELNLIRHLLKFPYLVEEVAVSFEANALTSYALETASLFHKFYEADQVISKDEKLTQARLSLLKATQITIKNALDLLGVSAPEHM